MQQRAQTHARVAGSQPSTGSAATVPVVRPAQPLSDALLVHSLAGCLVAFLGTTSPTAFSTAPQAVHLFFSALMFGVLGVVGVVLATELLSDDDGLPLIGLTGLAKAAVTAGVAAVFSLFATSVQRFVFGYAMKPRRLGIKEAWYESEEAASRLMVAWLINFALYGGAAAGSYLIVHHYELIQIWRLEADFPPAVSFALICNIFGSEPLAVLLALVAICIRNSRRTRTSPKKFVD